jgi:transposase
MGFVRGEDRQQCTLFPVSLDELVGPDHVCRVIAAFVAGLHLAELGFERACASGTGRPPYDPADLLMLYLYGYLHRIRSSRRLEQECYRNVEVMWLLNRLRPDHKTIAEFRRRNGAGLRSAGAAFIRFCVGVGLVRGDWVVIDGSKFQAVASSKAIQDATELAERDRQLQQRIAQYLQELEAADDRTPEREFDPTALRAALNALVEQRQQVQIASHTLQREGRRRRVVSEPEAVVLKGRGPGYNVQTAVDAKHAIIVAHQVTAQARAPICGTQVQHF